MCKVTLSVYEFMDRFPTSSSARKYLEQVRWNGHPTCIHCSSERIHIRKRTGYFKCLSCKKDFTVCSNTIFERSHIPLQKWFYAMYLVATSRKGISSLQLSKEIGVTQKSSWFLLQRLRESCKNDGIGLLRGIVEADETYIGGKEHNKHEHNKLKSGRGMVGKTAVVGMRERGGKVKAQVVSKTDSFSIQTVIRSNVDQEAILCTDEHGAYKGLTEYDHQVVVHSVKKFVDGMAHTNGIESVWAILKRGFYGIYHSFSEKHLQRYVDEFSYRLNEGNCNVPSIERLDALMRKTFDIRLTYKELIA